MMQLKSAFRIFKKKCPKCPDGRLNIKNWIRATCTDGNGRRYPDSWSYYECEQCQAKLKIFIGGEVAKPSTEEWSKHCQ